ncbi:MAG: VanW family protein [bacterium]|nr:VanW family protein [bacterium]
MKFSIQKHNFVVSWRLIMVAFFGILLAGTPIVDMLTTRGEIYPGVRVGNVNIGGQTPQDAKNTLQTSLSNYAKEQITFTLQDRQTTVPLSDIVSFDIDPTVVQAQTIGNTGPFWARALSRIEARFKGTAIAPISRIDKSALTKILHDRFSDITNSPKDARFSIAFTEGKPSLEIIPESSGIVIDADTAYAQLLARVAILSIDPIPLTPINTEPTLRSSDLESLRGKVEELLARPPKEITIGANKYTITPEILSHWISAEKKDDIVQIALSKDSIAKWLLPISKEIARVPIDAVFTVSSDGKRVTKFNPGTAGVSLLWNDETISRIADGVLSGTPVTLLTEQTAPRLSSSPEAEKFGIKELVGRGITNFKGSPVNRVKNIKRGAELLNGLLIAPGEEFSVLDHLRPFTFENGYFSELVIKAGRTVPEIGGGLCQISTTMFRVALNAGLPITERHNHGYRVSYYEPPIGMDATIYDPSLDFKFINDTGNWLLLVTHIKGTDLTFELWGTKDGRIAVSSTPEVSNFKQPPAKRIIETLDLPPGKIKCTEKARIGSDARFTYTVTYPDGRIVEKEFFSRYRPWQEVCLLGVTELTPVETPPESVPLSPDIAPPIVVN